MAAEIIEKPWGREILLEKNDRYVLKQLEMNAGHRCSLQYHKFKQETFYVIKGLLKVEVGPTKDNLKTHLFKPGESLTLTPYTVHRMEAVENSVYLEASTIELDDVVRLNDDYNRAQAATSQL